MQEGALGGSSISLLNFTLGIIQCQVQQVLRSTSESVGVDPLPGGAGEEIGDEGNQPVTIHGGGSQLRVGLQQFCTERESGSTAQVEGPLRGGIASGQVQV